MLNHEIPGSGLSAVRLVNCSDGAHVDQEHDRVAACCGVLKIPAASAQTAMLK